MKNWRDSQPTRTFEFGAVLLAGDSIQMIVPAETKEHAALVKALWEQDEPADGYRSVRIERGVRVQREEFLVVISFYRVVDRKAKRRATLYVQHSQAAYLLAYLWERRGRARGERYVFRVWTPKCGVDHGSEVTYDGPYTKVPEGILYQIGLSRTREWNEAYMSADVPF